MKIIKNLNQHQVQDALLYTIAIIFAGIGIYHGAIGFTSVMDSSIMAWIFMGAIGLGMLLMDFRLKDELENHRRPSRIVQFIFIYSILALVNMLGNFNTFFTKPLKGELITKERESLSVELKELMVFTSNTLEKQIDPTERTRAVKYELSNLKNEITDEDNLGIGDSTTVILARISKYLDNTVLRPPSKGKFSSRKEALKAYQVLEKDILSRLKTKTQDHENSRLVKDYHHHHKAVEEQLGNLAQAGMTKSLSDDEQVMQEAVITYNNLVGFVRPHAPNQNLQARTLELSNYGNFFYAMEVALSGKYPEAAWIALLQAFFIDFIVPIIFLMAIGRRNEKDLKVTFAALKKELTREKANTKKLKQTIGQLKVELSKVKEHLSFS